MSHSSEDDILSQINLSSNKKRRVQNQRACDRCRQKKSQSLITPSFSILAYLLPQFVVCPIVFSLSFSRIFDLPQVMEPHQAQNALIAHPLVVIVSSPSLQRCFFFFFPPYPTYLLIDASSQKTRGPPKRYISRNLLYHSWVSYHVGLAIVMSIASRLA
jgi:hypothetical protein